jgi:hypothetical protein
MNTWLHLLGCFGLAVALTAVAYLFGRAWQRWQESKGGSAVSAEGPGTKIGHQLFTDVVAREVFEDRDGRQYVLDDADRRVSGRWLPPADEPYNV